MNVLVPFVSGMLHQETQEAVVREADSAGWDVFFVELDRHNRFGYWQLLSEWWAKGEGIAIAEQDVVVPEGVFQGFDACPEPVCLHPYQIGTNTDVDCLGCNRYSKQLTRDFPEALEVVGKMDQDGNAARDWRRLDIRLAKVLDDRGIKPHRHSPSAKHLHLYGKES